MLFHGLLLSWENEPLSAAPTVPLLYPSRDHDGSRLLVTFRLLAFAPELVHYPIWADRFYNQLDFLGNHRLRRFGPVFVLVCRDRRDVVLFAAGAANDVRRFPSR